MSQTTGSRKPPSYASPETLFPMLGIPDTGRASILHELDIVCQYANSYADRLLRQKLGKTNSAGNPVDLPLTRNTRPPLTQSFLDGVYRLAVGYWRFQQSDDRDLWDDAVEKFTDAVDEEFGFAWSHGYTVETEIDVVPNPAEYRGSGQVLVTLHGSNFRGMHEIALTHESGPTFDRANDRTVLSDRNGDWTAGIAITPDSVPAVLALTASDGSLADGSTRRCQVRVAVQPAPEAVAQ